MKKSVLMSIIAGMGILAFGLYNVHSRCAISEGGLLGATLLIRYWFHISPAVSSFILDMSFFLLGTLVMGKGFLGLSVTASACYSLWYRFFEWTGPVLPDLSGHLFTAAVLGGILVGIGAGLVVRKDIAAGGDDALALTINKLFGFKVSSVYFFSDAVILLLSLSYIPLRDILWSLLSVKISSSVIELMCSLPLKLPEKRKESMV